LLPLLVALVAKLIPPEVFAECRSQAENLWQDGKPKKWCFALPIVAFWLLLIFVVIRIVVL